MNFIRVIFIIVCILIISRLEGQIAVIAHQDVASDTISSAQLRDIYTGDISFWPDGKPIVVCDLNDEMGIHDRFYDFIAISSSRAKSIWMKRMLSGQSDPPLIFQTGENLAQRIAEIPGAIGFIDEQEITGTVKVLLRINIRKE